MFEPFLHTSLIIFSELTELSSRLEKTIKDLDNVKAQAQQTEEELRDQLEKERMNVGRKDRDMQVQLEPLENFIL